jgi:hypothetical protein
MVFVIVYEGETGNSDDATPIIVSDDPAIVEAVADAFYRKIGAKIPAAVRPLGTTPPAIGTTRSGKDVFGVPSYQGHWQFSAEDHEDAARIHEQAGRMRQAAQHRHKARTLRASEPVPQPELRGPKAKVKGVPKRGAEPVSPPTPEPEPVPPPAANAEALPVPFIDPAAS